MCTQIEEYDPVFASPFPDREPRLDPKKLSLFTKIASLLQNLIEIELESEEGNKIRGFDMDFIPKISILDYLKRLDKYLRFSEEDYYITLIYIDRFIEKNGFHLRMTNVYNVIIASLVISSKFYHDVMYNNAVFAKIAGVSIAELNILEMQFFKAIEFQLFVEPTELRNYVKKFNDFF